MSNNVRNVTKQLLGAEDVAFGRGVVQQNRGGTLVPVHKLDLDLPVVDEAELAVTNPTVYPKASIGSRLFVAVNGQYQELSNIVPVIYRVGGALSTEYPYCENGNVIAKWTGAFPKTLTLADGDFSGAGWQIYTVGSGRTIVSETQPPISYGEQGMRWYNPSLPATFIYYVDGDSGQWVEEAHEGVDGALRSDLQNVNSTVPIAGLSSRYVSKGNILRYGSPSLDVADLINAAIAANGFAYVPYGTYLHFNGTVTLDNGQSIFFENARIESQAGSYAPFIAVEDKTQWSILGACNYIGTLVTGLDTGNEIGLDIKGGNQYTVTNFKAYKCRSHGIRVRTGGVAPVPRGDQGQFIGCAASECRTGVENLVDTSTEFNVWTNLNITGCLDGLITPAGNALYCGGNIVDNVRGVTISNGPNHAHGIISAMNINHNQEYNLKTVNVVYGQTIDGCHLYGNGGTTSPIWFENSKGICVSNSHIDCPVYNDGTAGANAILNNYMPGVDAQLLGTNPEMLRVLGNWTNLGSWVYNDASSEFVNATRGGTSQGLSSGTVLLFNNKISDKRSLYNVSTGLFTAPVFGYYSIQANIVMGATGMTAGATIGYVALKKDGTDVCYAPVVAISATLALCSIKEVIQTNAAETLSLQSFATATGLNLAISQSRLTISLQ